MIALIFVAAVGSLLVSYAKARAEGLGLECKTGLLARPERVVILAIGLLTGTTLWALLLLASLSHFTAIERIVHVWRATLKAGGHNVVTSPSVEDTGNVSGRHSALNTDDIASVNTVPTSLPPLSGSVHQD
jgi:CDP-diacylglycerol--glycerol-3-phosphate 3-phosphatidyltransferase